MANRQKGVAIQSPSHAWTVALNVIAGPETAKRLGVPEGTVIDSRDATAVLTTNDSSKEG